MSTEIELKLALPKTALTALRRHPLIAGAEKLGNAQTLLNTYYDTPTLTLREDKVAVRTRKQGRAWLQTVKCAAPSSGGLSARPEWEQPFIGGFDFDTIEDAPLARRLNALRDQLTPVFTTRFRRQTYRLRPTPEVEILLMVDTGTIDANERSAPICEIELELVSGEAQDLFAVACQLADNIPLLPADRSKAERGYRLFANAPETPTRAGKSPLHPQQSPLDAFRALAGDCLHQWQANALAMGDHDDPEYIHQLRIALRRLRSLIKLFAPALPPTFVDEWSATLRTAATELGGTRDVDVFLHDILAPVEPGPLMPADFLDGLRAHAQSQVDAHRGAAGDLTADPRQGQRMLALAAQLNALDGNALDAAADLSTFARLQLGALRKRARKRFAAARAPAPEDLHELRVSLKQLRYGAEFFLPLFDARTLKQHIRMLREGQDLLGYLNDVEIARNHVLNWSEAQPALSAPAHFLIGWHAPRCARVRRRILLEIEPLLWGKTPWKA
ncbi:MAG: CHAD domain-containing protein [Rhodocyclaceae bacterium]|nr:CHAD domain-containing protein [Rhodocyclaceae bacterium]